MRQETKGAISRDLLRTFFLSFQFSQGDAKLQRGIFYRLGPVYHQRIEACAEISDPMVFLKAVGDIAVGMKLPQAHKGLLAQQVADEFRTMWWTAQDAALGRTPPLDYDYADRDIALGIITKDLYYMSPNAPRPSAKAYPGGDPHFSYMREYILGQRPTPCPELTGLFAGVRACEMSVRLSSMEQLAEAWELAHPGQSFYPVPSAIGGEPFEAPLTPRA